MPSNDVIRFPKNYTAYIVGSATAGWKQEVKMKVQNLNGTDELQCTFEGTNHPMAVTSGGLGFMKQEAVVIEADNTIDRQIELDFRVFRVGATIPSDIKGFNKDTHSPLSWVTTYTVNSLQSSLGSGNDSPWHWQYSTEDGGDNDYHDTTLIVTFVKE
ncbi:hypothetical protein M405DRAFT_936900 [Rhizopogon salebrosus TDB-379]|nr:hypothetical protein M405DRAFT_936900 [Rhizopogon salebrosus TDB-379]